MDMILAQRALSFEHWFKAEAKRNPEMGAIRKELLALAEKIAAREGNYDNGAIASAWGVITAYALVTGFLSDVEAHRAEYLAAFLAVLGTTEA